MTVRRKKRIADFVLDGSVTLAWHFPDEANAYARSVVDRLPAALPIVPAIWHLEVANSLIVAERRKRTTAAKNEQFVSLLTTVALLVDDQTTARAWGDTLRLARAHQLSAYDAAYLELALRLGLPLATLDEQLRAALRAVGGVLYLTE